MSEPVAIRRARRIGGILFLLAAIFTFAVEAYLFKVLSFIAFLGYLLVGVSALRDKKDSLCAIGFRMIVALQLAVLAMSIYYSIGDAKYGILTIYSESGLHFSPIRALVELIPVVAYWKMARMVTKGDAGSVRGRELPWFTPAALYAVYPVVKIVMAALGMIIRRSWVDFYWDLSLLGLVLSGVLHAAVLLCLLSWITGIPLYEPKEQGPDSTEDGYYPMLKHILLLIFTFGIWYFIWIYKRTRYYNQSQRYPKRSPRNQVLLCLFIPMYLLWWNYDSARRLDELMEKKGIRYNDLTAMITVFGVLMPFLPPIFHQERINAVILAPAPTAAPAPAAAGASSEEIRQFHELIECGILSEDEFTAVKRKRLGL